MTKIRRMGSPHYARATRRAKPRLACGHSHDGGEHAERPHLVAVHDEGHLLVLALQRGDIEKGQVVLRSGYREARVLAQSFELDERPVVAGRERLAHFLVEAYCPVEGRAASALHEAQVVNDVAAARHQHTLVAQRREPLSGFVVECGGLRAVDAQLDDGDVRTGVRVFQDRPGAMVESPRIIEPYLDGLEQLAHARGKPWIARRRILDVEQGLRETV